MSKKDAKKGEGKGKAAGSVDPMDNIEMLLASLQAVDRGPDDKKPIGEMLLLDVAQAATRLWNLALQKEAKRDEIIGMEAITVINHALKHGTEDMRLPLMGCLSVFAKAEEALRDIMKGLPFIIECFKSNRERLLDATCLTIKTLASWEGFPGKLSAVMEHLVAKLSVPMSNTLTLYSNIMGAIDSLAMHHANVQLLFELGALPHIIRFLQNKDKFSSGCAASVLVKMFSVAQDEWKLRVLEERCIPKLLNLCRKDRVDQDGQTASTQILVQLANLDLVGQAVVSRIIEDDGIPLLLGLLNALSGDEGKGGKKSKKGKKGKAKAPVLNPSQDAMQQAVGELMAKMAVNVDAPEIMIQHAGIQQLEMLMDSRNEITRGFAREALWNLNYFALPGQYVDRFNLGQDIGLGIRERSLRELRTEQTPLRSVESRVQSAREQPPEKAVDEKPIPKKKPKPKHAPMSVAVPSTKAVMKDAPPHAEALTGAGAMGSVPEMA